MAYLALYRKYRPSGFDGLIGQDHIVKTLTNQIANNMIGHAYLFTGTRGTGKTSAAKIFARAINCLEPINGSPCGKCEVCKALSDPSNIDVIEIDAASNNGVNEIRDLREKVQYPPVSCKYKVYIIDEVHMLTGAAFNALLKTLEEPPKHAVFILATTEVHKIPATILSRCMRFDFRLIPTEVIAELIEKIYKDQNKEYEKEAVYAIAKAGEGSIRDALSVADIALSYGTGKLLYDDVMEILGASNNDLLSEFVTALLKGESGNVLDSINKLCSLGKSIGVLTKDVISFLRDLIVIKTCNNPNAILTLPESVFNGLKQISELSGESRLIRAMEIFSDAETNLKYSTHPRVVFETAAIKACKPDSDLSFDALTVRINELEKLIKSGASINNTAVAPQKVIEKQSEPEAEIKSEVSPENLSEKANDKIALSDIAPEQLKGLILSNLRNIGSEMIWNLMQNVSVSVSGGDLVLETVTDSDRITLDSDNCKSTLKQALCNVLPFNVIVKQSEKNVKIDQFDNATDKLKKIFGDDIVILK